MDINQSTFNDIDTIPDVSSVNERRTDSFKSNDPLVEYSTLAKTKSSVQISEVESLPEEEHTYGPTANETLITKPNVEEYVKGLHDGEDTVSKNGSNSWDTISQNSELSDCEGEESGEFTHEFSSFQIPTCSDIMKLLPPELPILCNIAQKVHGKDNVRIELTFINSEDNSNSWKSVNHTKNASEPKGRNLNNSVQCENNSDISVQVVLSQEELEQSGLGDDESHHTNLFQGVHGTQNIVSWDSEMTEEKIEQSSDKQGKKFKEPCRTTCETMEVMINHKESNKSSVNANISKHGAKSLSICKTRSISTGRNYTSNLNCSKYLKPIVSYSADDIHKLKKQEFLLKNGILIDYKITDAKIGDTMACTFTPGNYLKVDAASVLKPYINSVQPLRLYPQDTVNNGDNINRVYECCIVSLNNLLPNGNSSNMQEQNLNNSDPDTNEQSTASAPPSEQTESTAATGSSEENPEIKQQSSSNSLRAKHRSIRQPLPQVVKHNAGRRLLTPEAWVLLDSEGNTQEVSQRDVNILLGGRSADSVVAESTAHSMPHCAVQRVSRSETGADMGSLDPIIKESLLLLSQDDIGGEQLHPRRLHLERKAGNMLLYIGMDINLVPSVRFINIDTEMVELWRHSQEDHNRCTVVHYSET